MPFCDKCGAPISDTAKFCGRCGAPTALGVGLAAEPRPPLQPVEYYPRPYQPPYSQSQKGSRKTLIAVVVIVAIAAVAVGVYLATRSGPSPSVNIAGASSLQFTVDVTGGSSAGTYKYMAKNIGTSNMMIRVEGTTSSLGNFVYIVNGAQQKAWVYLNGAWMDLSSTFSALWSSWNSAFTGYRNNLVNWPGYGDWTYTAPDGSTIRIHDITVNPSLADSLFSHS